MINRIFSRTSNLPAASIRRLAVTMIATLLIAACGRGDDAEPGDEASQTQAAGVRSVSVATVVQRPMAGSLTASGLLVPRQEIAVGSEIGGYRVAEVLADEGDMVEANAVLARLDPGLLKSQINQAAAAVRQAQAQAKQAAAEAARVDGLDGTGILSAEQIGARRSQAAGAEAAVAVARAQLGQLKTQQERLSIRAPVAGLVLERSVRRGDVASPAQTMFRIAREGLIELDAEVPEDVLNEISVGEQADVWLPAEVEIKGKARLISPRVDPQTKLGRVRVALPLDARLRAGGYARAVFSRVAQPVPTVPEKAVQFEASGPLLVVIDADNKAQRMPVKTGSRANGFVAIEDGPPVGSRVALGGGAFLLDGDRVEPVMAADGGHTERAERPRQPAQSPPEQ